jgi:serine/threonine protein kinase/F0F1-type ATP synthase assembly protein I
MPGRVEQQLLSPFPRYYTWQRQHAIEYSRTAFRLSCSEPPTDRLAETRRPAPRVLLRWDMGRPTDHQRNQSPASEILFHQGQAVKLHIRIVRFIALSAWDLLVPSIIAHPVSLVRNFYECFLVADPFQKLELLREARNLSDAEIEEIVDAMTAEWKAELPHGQLTEPQRELLRQLVLCLKTASQPAAAANPSEALRKSLNSSLLARGREQINPINLKPDQYAVGRSMVLAGMQRASDVRGPRQLPHDAPQIPGYELINVLGDGGFSKVYLARHIETDEIRAIKVGRLEDNSRFEREVRLLVSLKGSYVVRYYEHGRFDGNFWIAMEYLGEYTLTNLIQTTPSAEYSLLMAGQVLRGLENLHKAGVIHRDLKPDNVMVDSEFRLKLIDFGLAKHLPGGQALHSQTITVGLIGTPRYMSPEQILEKRNPTPAADLWAFGCILFELLNGDPPFESNNIMALGHEIMTKTLRFEVPKIPEEVRPFLQRCLNRDEAERWPNAMDALNEFSRVAGEARRRLRHERFQDSWGQIVEKCLLERFAALHKGQVPDDAASLFAELAKREGIAEVDDERLSEILGPIFFSQTSREVAGRAVVDAKAKLQKELVSLTGSELTERSAHIRELEEARETQTAAVREKVRALLADELRSWEEKKRIAAKKESKQKAEREREEREKEAKRRRVIEEQEAERLRVESEKEATRWQRKQQAARRRKIAGFFLIPAMVGAMVFALVGALMCAVPWPILVVPVVLGLCLLAWFWYGGPFWAGAIAGQKVGEHLGCFTLVCLIGGVWGGGVIVDLMGIKVGGDVWRYALIASIVGAVIGLIGGGVVILTNRD